ncbi:MAG: hypothetical protein IT162_21515 [Bryobacterales bacterium]|nr:hypothetical protein [Bryobacterales bacterium]
MTLAPSTRAGVIILAIAMNAAAAIPWWAGLALSPAFRRWFVPVTTPDSALLAFASADLLLFAGAGLFAAYGLWRQRGWAPNLLLIHTGAACYAALYMLQQSVQTGEAWPGALAMSPSLLLLPYACWLLCPRTGSRSA